MPKSTASGGKRKAAKPPKEFPLWIHKGSGRWCRKIKGKFHYFGKVADDPNGEAALKLWAEDKDDLLAGRKPRRLQTGTTVHALCNHFMHFKKQLLDSGELAQRTWDRYHDTCERVLEVFGETRPADDLRPEDFAQLRAELAKTYGPVALGNEIQIVRSIFKYGVEAELLEKAVRFGPGFKKPSAKTLRINRAKAGLRMFERKELLAVLRHATVNLKAMALLGINAGLGNTDLALLPICAIDLDSGWLDYPRPKTGMPRRVPLWPETVKRIRAALKARREPKNPADVDLLFIGRRGQSYIGDHKGYRVTQEMDRALEKAGLDRKGLSFYALRHTFQTIAEGARDLAAVQAIMGHAPSNSDMSAVYRERVDDERLKAVTDHVRTWLFPPKKAE
jgi:integrase